MAKIHIVDDDSEIRAMLGQALIRQGYGIVEARNGNEALAQCHTPPFLFVLLRTVQ